jgi:hypothetical protein
MESAAVLRLLTAGRHSGLAISSRCGSTKTMDVPIEGQTITTPSTRGNSHTGSHGNLEM